MPNDFYVFIIVGVIAGVASGMFGIGGGVIIVPSLILFAGLQPVEAIGTSLAALLLPVSIFAVLAYHRAGLLDLRSAGLIAVGLLITSWVGAQVTLGLSADTLKQVYGGFLIVMSWRFVEPRKLYAEYRQRSLAKDKQNLPSAAGDAVKNPEMEMKLETAWYVIWVVGLIAGVASGMFGIGGGVVIVPALVALLQYDQKKAVATSLGALLLPVGLPGVLSYYAADKLDISLAALVACGLVLGTVIGAQIALNLPSKRVKQLYGVFLFFVGLDFIFRT